MSAGVTVFDHQRFHPREAPRVPPVELIAEQKCRDWQRLLAALERLEELPPGWNGQRAEAPDHSTLRQAVNILKRLVGMLDPCCWKSAFVNPTPSGGVQLEWELASGKYAELEIAPGGNEFTLLLEDERQSSEQRFRKSEEALGQLERFLQGEPVGR